MRITFSEPSERDHGDDDCCREDGLLERCEHKPERQKRQHGKTGDKPAHVRLRTHEPVESAPGEGRHPWEGAEHSGGEMRHPLRDELAVRDPTFAIECRMGWRDRRCLGKPKRRDHERRGNQPSRSPGSDRVSGGNPAWIVPSFGPSWPPSLLKAIRSGGGK
jgi:hypothetical protein